SLGLALFASTYRATLSRGQSDQAGYAVPADVVLTEDLTKLVAPLDVGPVSRYERLGRPVPVLRLDGGVPRLEGNAGFTLLGVPAVRRARLPRDARGGLLFSIAIALSDTELHDVANAGINAQQRGRGTLTFGPLRAGGRAVAADWRAWVGVAGARLERAGRSAR